MLLLSLLLPVYGCQSHLSQLVRNLALSRNRSARPPVELILKVLLPAAALDVLAGRVGLQGLEVRRLRLVYSIVLCSKLYFIFYLLRPHLVPLLSVLGNYAFDHRVVVCPLIPLTSRCLASSIRGAGCPTGTSEAKKAAPSLPLVLWKVLLDVAIEGRVSHSPEESQG